MELPEKRKEVAHQFVERWADRFIAIAKTHGQFAAEAWAGTFLNRADLPHVIAAVNKKVMGSSA